MAKRFTDSTKWNDNWFSNLTDKEKLTWIYILDTCNHAGIWEKNLKVLNFHIGSNFVDGDLNKIFSGKFIEVNDKWFIPNFIKFQYGKGFLTTKTAAVISARELLIEQGFIQQDVNGNLTLIKNIYNPSTTLTEGLNKGYDRVKDKEEDKRMDVSKVLNKNENKRMDVSRDVNMVKYKFIKYNKYKDEYEFEFKTKLQKEELTFEELKIYLNEEEIYYKLNKNE
jgi:hypothetical protein